MKNKILIIIFIVALICLCICLNVLYSQNNLRFKTKSYKNELTEILEIKDATSFKPIYKKWVNTGFGSAAIYYEIKFEISKVDYEINELKYYEESYYEALVDCHYKEEKDQNTYMCIVRVSNIMNKELYKKINNLK